MFHRLQKVISKILSLMGVTDYMWRNLPNGLYVFNYHRIGEPSASEFDHAIFSSSRRAFNLQVAALKQNFIIIDSYKLVEIMAENKLNEQRYAMITFDDGYVDNYLLAYPILKAHAVSASFYISTDFIDSKHITWWDEIAYILRNSCGQTYQLPNTSECFQLIEENINNVIRQIINAAKSLQGSTINEILYDIRDKFPQAVEQLKEQDIALFMSWSQIIEMANNGMEIGSHTVSHKILSQLSDEEQLFEITHSKTYLEEKLNRPVISIAYPVGRYHCYNQTSLEHVKKAKYLVGFNNEPGSHRSINNILDINRFCVARDDIEYLKFECCFK